jgi:hypothetical protein
MQSLLNSRYNYFWKYDNDNMEDIYDMQYFTIPFQIVKNTVNKYRQPQPKLMDTPHIFRPYTKSQIIYEKGGKIRRKNNKYKKTNNKYKKTNKKYKKTNKKYKKTNKKYTFRNKNTRR